MNKGCIEIQLKGFNKKHILKTPECVTWYDAIVETKTKVNVLI
jgi:hypothetical protein